MKEMVRILVTFLVTLGISAFSQSMYNFTILALNYTDNPLYSGLPIPNLDITLRNETLGTYYNITDSDGFAHFNNIPEGLYNITATYNGNLCTIYDPTNNDAIMTTLVVDSTTTDITIDVDCWSSQNPPQQTNYNLSVYVYDNSTGAPISDFMVYVNETPLDPYGTNQDGLVYGMLSAGYYTLTLEGDEQFVLESDRNAVLTNYTFFLNQDTTLKVYLVNTSGSGGGTPGTTYNLTIRVLDNSTENPVSDLMVYINGSAMSPVGTYPDGSLAFQLSPGTYVITLGNNLEFVTESDRNTPRTNYTVDLTSDMNLTLYLLNYSGGGSSGGEGYCEGGCNVGNISFTVIIELDEGLQDDTFIVGAFNETYGCMTNVTTQNGTGQVTLNLTEGYWYIGVYGNSTGLMNFTQDPIEIPSRLNYTFHFKRLNIVNGTVTYQGNPVEGYVFIHNENYTISAFDYAENGIYTIIGIPNGTYTIEFYPDDFSLPTYRYDNLTVNGDTPYDINLSNIPGVKINGTITLDGNGVNGYIAVAEKIEEYSYRFVTATMISNGSFIIYGLPEESKEYRLIIDTDTGLHKEYEVNITQEDIDRGYKEFIRDLAEGIKIEGYVETSDGSPVVGCTVFVMNEYEFYITTTNSSGYYVVYGVSNNTEYIVEVRPDLPTPENNFTPLSYPSKSRNVYVDGNEVVNFTLEQGVSLSGSVTGINCSSAPYGCGWVNAFGENGEFSWATIDQSGNFVIRGLESGKRYDLLFTFAPEVGKPDYWVRDVLINDSGNTLQVDLSNYQSAIVRGRILANGNPVQGADVILCSDTYGGWARTDNNGEFEIFGVPVGENYTISVMHPDYAEYSGNVFVNSTEVLLPDITLGSGYTVSGYVLDNNNNPIPNAEVEIWNEYTWKHTTTDQNGYYSIGGLQRGEYNYYVWLPDGNFISGEIIVSGNTQQNISVPQEHNLAVNINGPTSNVHIDLIGELYSMSVDLDSTSYTFEDIPDGNYTIIVSAPGYETNITNITVNSDKTVDIILNALSLATHTISITINASALSNVEAYYVILSGNGQTFYNKSQTQNQFTFDNVPEGNYTLTAMVVVNGAFHENITNVTVNSASTSFGITVR